MGFGKAEIYMKIIDELVVGSLLLPLYISETSLLTWYIWDFVVDK